jgi:FkbM family methyltransferase
VSLRRQIAGYIPSRYHLPIKFWHHVLRGDVEKEFHLLPHLARPDRVSIDVGANFGLYTYALARLSARVESFEPLAENLRLLRAARVSNVSVHQVALSSDAGTQTLRVPRVGSHRCGGLASLTVRYDTADEVQVEVRRLDDYRFSDVGLIKIDVEGHELEVLSGARETIVRYLPGLLIEIEQRHLSFPMSRVFGFVSDWGYAGYFLVEKELRSIEEFNYEEHQQPFLASVHSSRYVNNFLFVHRSRVDVWRRLGLT